MKAIRFTRGGSNTILGNFGPGDVARCSEALARHLVTEVKVAEYDEPPAPPVARRKVKK